jgi:hypothetical protein
VARAAAIDGLLIPTTSKKINPCLALLATFILHRLVCSRMVARLARVVKRNRLGMAPAVKSATLVIKWLHQNLLKYHELLRGCVSTVRMLNNRPKSTAAVTDNGDTCDTKG